MFGRSYYEYERYPPYGSGRTAGAITISYSPRIIITAPRPLPPTLRYY